MRRIPALVSLLIIVVAACQPPLRDGRVFNPDPNLVVWERSPQAVIFRADVVGGASAFQDRSAIPDCTIYGDNRVVWVNTLALFQLQVLEDRLSDEAISAFVQYLTVHERIYTYQALLSEIQPEAGTLPVVETVQLNVNDVEHQADSLSGWDDGWFTRVLDACKQLSEAPVLVVPSSGWVSAQVVPFDPVPPLATWDAEGFGTRLASLPPDAPQWFSGASVSTLWQMLHSLPTNLLFEDDGSYYQVALQVPGVTRDSPPAPGDGD